LVLVLGILIVAANSWTAAASAATLYWDANGSGGAGGYWTASYWTGDSSGASNPGLWQTGSDAQFSIGGTGTLSLTVTVTGQPSLGNLTVGQGNVTLVSTTGGSFVLTGTSGATWSTNAGASLAVEANVDAGSNLFTIGGAGNTTISGNLSGTGGLAKLGIGTVVLSGDNDGLSGNILVSQGTLNVQTSTGLGPNPSSGSGTASPNAAFVAAGASLEFYHGGGPTMVVEAPITLNGAGVNGGGALVNGNGGTTLSGQVTLGSNVQVNTIAGELTLAGAVSGVSTLTKTGSGILVLAGASDNSFPGKVVVNAGTLEVMNDNALGTGGNNTSVTIQNGSTLAISATSPWYGNVAIPTVSLTLNGTGANNTGAIDNVQGSNTFFGPLVLAGSSQVNVNGTQYWLGNDTLTLSGNIGGTGDLTKTGSGTLVLSGTGSTFTGTVNVAAGTLSVSGIGAAGTAGPLGAGTGAITLGDSGTTGILVCTSTGTASSNRAFTLATGGTGSIQVAGNLALSGVIGGGGSFDKSGPGTLTLSGRNTYAGPTTVDCGTLAIAPTGSIASTAAIAINAGATLQCTSSGGGGQLPLGAQVTISGGSLIYNGSGTIPGGETLNSLALGDGQSTIETTAGGTTFTPYLKFTQGVSSRSVGATVNFSSDNHSAIYLPNTSPGLSNGILGGWAFWPTYSFGGQITDSDFATLVPTTGAPAGFGAVQDYNYTETTTTGTVAQSTKTTPLNVELTTGSTAIAASTTLNTLKLAGSATLNLTDTATLTLAAGGLIANSTGSIGGGTLEGSADGQLVVNTVQDFTIASVIADNGSATALVKTGSGTLILAGTNNTYTGSTVVDQGLLVANNVDALPWGGAFDVVAGGTLVLMGDNVPESSMDLAVASPMDELTAREAPPPLESPGGRMGAVPEPGTSGLLLAGVLCGLGWHMKNRRGGA